MNSQGFKRYIDCQETEDKITRAVTELWEEIITKPSREAMNKEAFGIFFLVDLKAIALWTCSSITCFEYRGLLCLGSIMRCFVCLERSSVMPICCWTFWILLILYDYLYYLLEFREDILKVKFKKQAHDIFLDTSKTVSVNEAIIITTSGWS